MQRHQDTAPRGKGWMAAALLGVVVGTALQLQQPGLWAPWVYAAWLVAALVLGAAASAGRMARVRTALAWVAAAALAFGSVGLRATHFAQRALDPAVEGRDISVTGIVAAMPQRNETGLRFRFEVESARDGAGPVRLPPQLYLGWYGSAGPEGMDPQRQPGELRAGERWQMAVRLKAPHGNLTPHGFDYELWLWEQGLQATGYVRAGPRDAPPQRIGVTWQHLVERARQAVRGAIDARVADRQAAGLLAALVVGDQNAIDRADWDVFRATGVAHLMSISGLHITMFAWACALAVGWLWRRSSRLCLAFPAQHAALLGGVAMAAAYSLFSGWGVPAQRTVWMLATVGLLRLSGRRWPWPQVWLLACAVVVVADPWALLQAGFWLSFVAVGVLFATDSGAHGAEPMRAAARFSSAFREQWVVTLALTPLTLLLFGQVSVVGLVANALAIPWVTLVVTPLALAGVLVAPLWDLAALALQALALYLGFLASLPWATFSTPAPPLWAAAAGLAGGLLLAMRGPWAWRALGLPLMLPVLLWQAPRPPPGEFELLAADIGQGNAVVVRTAAHTLVYDSGPRYSAESDAGHRVLVPLLRALGERVDTLMLSHRDSDHTGGAAAVLAMQPQAALVSSMEDGHELQALRAGTRCAAGQRWQWDGVDFELLHPQAADYEAAARPNAMSCVLRIANGRQTALLVGDIEQPQEARLVGHSLRAEPLDGTGTGSVAAAGNASTSATRMVSALRADVLLVPHHGSKTSSSEAFLDAVQPKLAIVQAGYRNRFGHPAAPVLARYAQRGIPVFGSPQCGAAWWRSLQPQAPQCQREAAPRYWHHHFPEAPAP